MGAWDLGVFDNDAAADWAAELDDSADPSAFVRETLAPTPAGGDPAQGSEGVIAAAAVVAALLADGPTLDEGYGPSSRPDLDTGLVPEALRALDAATVDGGDWSELWREAGQLAEARATVTPVRAALAARLP